MQYLIDFLCGYLNVFFFLCSFNSKCQNKNARASNNYDLWSKRRQPPTLEMTAVQMHQLSLVLQREGAVSRRQLFYFAVVINKSKLNNAQLSCSGDALLLTGSCGKREHVTCVCL